MDDSRQPRTVGSVRPRLPPGPVPSEIYNLTKGEASGTVWTSHLLIRKFDRNHIEVSVEKDLPPGELTRGNLEALGVVQRKYLRMPSPLATLFMTALSPGSAGREHP